MNESLQLPDSAIRLVFQLKSHMVKALAAAGADVSVMHVQTLKILHKCGPATAADLVVTLKRDKAQINRLLNPLLEQSVIKKCPHPGDKRSHLLELTSEGKELMKVIEEAEHRVVQQVTKGLSSEDVARFNELVGFMLRNLQT